MNQWAAQVERWGNKGYLLTMTERENGKKAPEI
jgi:hypothetical protein